MFKGGFMLEKEMKKRIFQKLEAMEESLNYDLDSLIELKSDIQAIYFFLYLLDKNSNPQ